MSSNFIERPRYVCSLGGAAATVTALPGAIPILHSASGCAGNFAWTQNGGSGLQVGGYCGSLTVPSSNVQEQEVVFGGADRLSEQIRNTRRVIDGELFVVLTGCVTEVIGDDIRSVVHEFRNDGLAIVGAETGGFKGTSYYGYDLVLQALFRDYVTKGTAKEQGLVNLWGIVPYMDPFWRGNLEGVRRLLESIGLRVNSFFTTADNLHGLRDAAGAVLNIIVSDVYGVEAAQVFEEVHGVPYLSLPLPVGPSASDLFLRTVADRLGLDQGRVETVIGAENDRYYRYLEPLTDCYNDLDLQRYAVVVGDANYAPALTRFLADDLGWLPELAVCTDQLGEEEQERIARQVGVLESGVVTTLVFETDGSEVLGHLNRSRPRYGGQKYFNAFSPAFVLGSSLERELAQSLGAAHLSVSFPVANRAVLDRGYTGYSGGLRLTEDLLSAVVAGR
ncbi:MAG TPA: nitrogenase component 1 [Geobacteraceae bacterium]